jgi:glycosyltransferase involved in cell wall biosynthesis
MKTLVIIPAYNTAGYVAKLIPSVKQYVSDIVVINDGSTDETSNVARAAGAEVLRHERNLGKGAALKTGFSYALGRDFDVVITLDSDGQHNPAYIPAFLTAFSKAGADLIIGSRLRDKADMPLDRRFSNWTTSRLISALLRTKIDDLQCGYRLYSRKLLADIQLESDRFEFETEIVIKAVKSGFKPVFIPIKVEYGPGFPTQINRLTDTLRWCRRVIETI